MRYQAIKFGIFYDNYLTDMQVIQVRNCN